MTAADFIRARKKADKRVRERAKALQRLAEEVGDPLADEIAALQEQATVHNLPVGDPIEGNPFLDGALEAVRAREQAEEEEPTEVFQQTAYPYGDVEESAKDRTVVAFPKQQMECPDRVTPEPRYFQTPLEKFEWLRTEQRQRNLTAKEIAWLRGCCEYWGFYARCFVDQWPEEDHRWLAEIAPYDFAEYITE